MSQHPSAGNNIYGGDVSQKLIQLQEEGSEENAAYILMRRIFPTISPTFLLRGGICHRDYAILELGGYGACLRCVSMYQGSRTLVSRSPLHQKLEFPNEEEEIDIK
ncbi:Glutathione synthase [Bertholletia excelsa]